MKKTVKILIMMIAIITLAVAMTACSPQIIGGIVNEINPIHVCEEDGHVPDPEWGTRLDGGDCQTEGYLYQVCYYCRERIILEVFEIGSVTTEPFFGDEVVIGEHGWVTADLDAFPKLPTCIENGETLLEVCCICGLTRGGEIIPASPDYHTPWVTNNATTPTCVNEGCTEEISCSTCGEILSASKVLPTDPENHGGLSVIPGVEATCINDGHTEGLECLWCKTVIIQPTTIPATGQCNVVEKDSQCPSTCTTTGLSNYRACSMCGTRFSQPTVTPPLGHEPSDWIVDVPHSSTNPGQKHKECLRCGKILETTSNDCTPGAWTVQTNPSLHADGLKVVKCTMCSKVIESEVLYALGSSGLMYTPYNNATAYVVSGIGTCTDTHLYIPSFYNGKPVVGIASDAFSGNMNITSLVIGGRLEFIETGAFYGCTNLRSVEFASRPLSDNVYYALVINTHAFSKTGISEIKYNDLNAFKSIIFNQYSLYECNNLTSISIPENVELARDAFGSNSIFEVATNIVSITLDVDERYMNNEIWELLKVLTRNGNEIIINCTDGRYKCVATGDDSVMVNRI